MHISQVSPLLMLRLVAGSLVILMATAGCGGGGPDLERTITGAGAIRPAPFSLPGQLLGLQVAQEDIADQIQESRRPYLNNVGLFSLRENDLVRATFQVSRFNDLARPNSAEFRNAIVQQVSARRPLQMSIGEQLIYATLENEQQIFLWFRDDWFYVLTVHGEYEFPITLLRRLVELEKHL